MSNLNQPTDGDGGGVEILSEEECKQIILALAAGSGDKGFSEADLDIVTDWAFEARLSETLLNGVLKGLFLLTIKDGEVAFVASPSGKEAYEQYKSFKTKMN